MTITGYSDAHSNGLIAFNPTAARGTADYGNLYIGSGDGHYNDADQKAQSLAQPQGKLLRINPLAANGAPYTVPSDNPFVGQSGALPEIWASGLRYPQSFSWDPATGKMYINDLGQAGIEEVNLGIKGANYGWSQREGTFATGYAYGLGTDNEFIYPLPPGAGNEGYTDPIAQYYHSEGYALGSGFLYRGSLIPALYGKYVMADIVLGRLFVFDPAAAINGPAPLTELQLTQDDQVINLPSAYGYDTFINGPRVDARLSEDANGELLLALKANGTIYRLEADVPEPPTWTLMALLIPLSRLRKKAG